MKNKFPLLTRLLAPIALMLLGVLLIFVPDTGSIFLSRVLGWGLTLAGMAFFLWAIFTREWGKLVIWFFLVSAGSTLIANPLALSAFVGRILGVVLILRSFREFLRSVTGPGKLLSLVLALVGIILVLMPMSASRLLFCACGVVLLVCGALQLIQRLKEHRYLDGGRDDIIDAL